MLSVSNLKLVELNHNAILQILYNMHALKCRKYNRESRMSYSIMKYIFFKEINHIFSKQTNPFFTLKVLMYTLIIYIYIYQSVEKSAQQAEFYCVITQYRKPMYILRKLHILYEFVVTRLTNLRAAQAGRQQMKSLQTNRGIYSLDIKNSHFRQTLARRSRYHFTCASVLLHIVQCTK